MSGGRRRPARVAAGLDRSTPIAKRAGHVCGVTAMVITLIAPARGAAPVAAEAPATTVRGSGQLALRLADQRLDVAAGGTLIIGLDLPDGTDRAQLADTSLEVAAHPPLHDRAAVDAVLLGGPARAIDTVTVATAFVAQSDLADLAVSIATESERRTAAALHLPEQGLYPLTVTITRGDETIGELLTFVHRLPAPDEISARPLHVAVAMSTATDVALDDPTMSTTGAVRIDEATIAELDRLAALVEQSPVPVATRVPPAVVDTLDSGPGAEAGAAVLDSLRAAMVGDDVLAAPVLPLDPSAAADAGQQGLYSQWLRAGEDALAAVASSSPQRTVVLLDHAPSAAGGALLRELGARLFVFTAAAYEQLGTSTTAGPAASTVITDASGVVEIAVDGGATVPGVVVDPRIADLLVDSGTDPTQRAVFAAAYLLAERERLAAAGDDPSRHGVVIATADLRLPDPEVFAALTDLLADTEGLEAVPLDTLGLRTATILDLSGQPLSAALPASVDGSIRARMAAAEALTAEADDTASMLDATTTRAAQWRRVIGLLATSALTDAEVVDIGAEMRAEFAAIRGAIEIPEAFAFTLTGRRSTVPIKITNNGDEPLSVLVRLSSPKLLFPDGPQLVTVEPGRFAEVMVRIEARSNGDSPVTLEVFTPNGGTRLGRPVPLRASVNAISGLGNLVTGALALVLLSWWVRHVRHNRRRRDAEATAGRHPVNGSREADTPGEPGAKMSPDAEASTLNEQ